MKKLPFFFLYFILLSVASNELQAQASSGFRNRYFLLLSAGYIGIISLLALPAQQGLRFSRHAGKYIERENRRFRRRYSKYYRRAWDCL